MLAKFGKQAAATCIRVWCCSDGVYVRSEKEISSAYISRRLERMRPGARERRARK